MTVQLAPSLLSADFAELGAAVRLVQGGGADLIHLDVMDGHFVPNITIGPAVVRAVRQVAAVPLDVHLMISEPDRYLHAFVEAGAAMLSVHVEALPHLHRTLQAIKALGARAGVALNPSTHPTAIEEVAGEADFVLVMSVNPGFAAQRFIPRTPRKIAAVRALLDAAGNPAPIEVDGGIDTETAGLVTAAGARILVAGNAIFGAADPVGAMRGIRAAAEAAVPRRRVE